MERKFIKELTKYTIKQIENDENISDNVKVCQKYFLEIEQNLFSIIEEQNPDLDISSSPLIRFLELVSFFSIDVNCIFEIKHYDKIDLKDDFLYKLPRHNRNYNSIKKYYEQLKQILQNRQFVYKQDASISECIRKVERKIIEDSDCKILMDYDSFKEFFKLFLYDVKKVFEISDEYSCFHTFVMSKLPEYGVLFHRQNFLIDILLDKLKENRIEMEDMEDISLEKILNKLINERFEFDEYALSTLDSFRKNWRFLCNLSKNEELIQYLSLLLEADYDNKFNLQNTIQHIKENRRKIEKIPSLEIFYSSMKYHYLLNYEHEEHTRATEEAVKHFFQKQIKENPNSVVFCLKYYVTLSIAIRRTQYFEILYMYACTLQ